jgi:hypothetical protein
MKGKGCTYLAPTRKGGRLRAPPPPPMDADDSETARNRAKGRPERDKVKRFRSWESIA